MLGSYIQKTLLAGFSLFIFLFDLFASLGMPIWSDAYISKFSTGYNNSALYIGQWGYCVTLNENESLQTFCTKPTLGYDLVPLQGTPFAFSQKTADLAYSLFLTPLATVLALLFCIHRVLIALCFWVPTVRESPIGTIMQRMRLIFIVIQPCTRYSTNSTIVQWHGEKKQPEEVIEMRAWPIHKSEPYTLQDADLTTVSIPPSESKNFDTILLEQESVKSNRDLDKTTDDLFSFVPPPPQPELEDDWEPRTPPRRSVSFGAPPKFNTIVNEPTLARLLSFLLLIPTGLAYLLTAVLSFKINKELEGSIDKELLAEGRMIMVKDGGTSAFLAMACMMTIGGLFLS